eukprot:CAMPEP_0195294116 /NCGR_PEP_ID=MMETSP0707-20130614/14142_1 /TAXON_ID=33640 /ORGANISM="Asterionellopsis glacialis, Strain CCMP134" /LENGTH=194 /DNA_ID=CAMNT_0040355007 /DNA_START=35 /DNA_END=619 /DNA_ORIENTATION=+
MNHVADILGLPLPCLQARNAVMKEPTNKSTTNAPCASAVEHWQGRISFMKDASSSSSHKLDDDTVSTCSLSDSESQQDSSLSFKMVTWSEPLVTEVRERPRTSRNDKSVLYWQERDYIEMRHEATASRRRNSSRQTRKPKSRRTTRLVKFADCAVTDVWTVPYAENKSQLFYTERELQEFLDEFVASLDKGMME